MDKTKIQQIEKEFFKLYGLTSSEIEGFMAEIKDFPEEGVVKVLEYLQSQKTTQNDLMKKMAENDKEFLPNLSNFLNNSSKNIKNEFEQSEKLQADDILKNI